MIFVVKDITMIFRKIKTILILISFKRYFSQPEKSILKSFLTLRRHCNSGARLSHAESLSHYRLPDGYRKSVSQVWWNTNIRDDGRTAFTSPPHEAVWQGISSSLWGSKTSRYSTWYYSDTSTWYGTYVNTLYWPTTAFNRLCADVYRDIGL